MTDLWMVATVVAVAFALLFLVGLFRFESRLINLKAEHAADLEVVRAAAGQVALAEYKSGLWHEWSCPGPHDYAREPDVRKGPNAQYHCIRCGHVLWRSKFSGEAGKKAAGV